ncbi:haloacid dehalogenase, type II [Acidihalobacter yilgarnensis]|uniref:(S)-2-haloacid dehalogenase n=1 Tax=Acidihalobacter yilgarnensis TaxID=2819280 RepID=A0A1D8INB1_9GAMM|nr:haloacid dehalogenase type II [Acidihalobacter yilgarnensis]AOU97958.1 haloacid dehalogenase, type II [Acidihalobacter yilgarnensis]
MNRRIQDIKACIFDAYGTLFDFSSAAAGCTGVPNEKRDVLTVLWRDKQLQYTWLRSLQGRYVDFWQVTDDALNFALESLDLYSPELHSELMGLYLNLSAFPEVYDTLHQLRDPGFMTAILSNGTPRMLNAAVTNAGLAPVLDFVLSADDVKVYKTHPRVYEYALEQLDLRPEQVSFQSSNAWDAYAASDFGMQVVWCNRYEQKPERLPGSPEQIILSLDQLVEILAPARN